MDGSFNFLYTEPSNEPEAAKITPIKCGDYTQEEYEEAMEWLMFGDDKDESST